MRLAVESSQLFYCDLEVVRRIRMTQCQMSQGLNRKHEGRLAALSHPDCQRA